MRKLLLTLSLLVMTGPLLADAPVTDAPTAVLVGPTEIPPNSYVRVKTTGTIGDDPKLTVIPAVKNMDLVTFSDGSYGVTAELADTGTYTFFLAVNKGGKTAITTLVVSVAVPAPPPVPDASLAILQGSFTKDGSPTEKKAYLTAIYKQMADQKVATWKELSDLLSKTTADTFKENELVNLRSSVADILTQKLGPKNGPVNVTIQHDVFTAIAKLLENVH